MKRFFSFLLILTLLFAITACTAPEENEAEGTENTGSIMLSPNENDRKTANTTFSEMQMDFSLKLLKETAQSNQRKNLLLSPLSVQLALAMTANGATGETLAQMENLLAGGRSISELNQMLNGLTNTLPSKDGYKVKIANSVWFRNEKETLKINDSFLQINQNFYNAGIFQKPFNEDTKNQINQWVKDNTDGLIDGIIESIDQRDVMYLINTLLFDAEWEEPYAKENIRDGTFTDINGKKNPVEMMHSDEFYYLEGEKVTGFLKRYRGGDYCFVALLPKEDITLSEYIESLTPEKLTATIENAQNNIVYAALPKFSCENKYNLNQTLQNLGITEAFDPNSADFSALGQSAAGNLYIGEVLHKTFINVDALGTKAGAATSVGIRNMGMPMNPKTVTLDRPFLYMILETSSNTPLFIGTVNTLTN